MVVVGKFIGSLILRVIFTIIAFAITVLMNYMYCKKTNEEFTFAKFVLIF